MTSSNKEYSFPQKVWIVGGILALIVVLLLLLKATFSVLLLVLAGTLIAVFFRGLSGYIERKTKWNSSWSLAFSIIATLIIVALLFWMMGAKVQAQAEELSKTLPSTFEKAKTELSKSTIGQKIIEKISSPETKKQGASIVQTFFKSTFGILGDVYVVLFIGIFFTVAPKRYIDGIVTVIPAKAKTKARHTLDMIGENLKKWLKGKLFAMLVVFVLTSIGLVIMGIPMWLVLALIAGILNFIPNFGPLIAMIPAVLVGLMESPADALWVAGLYILVQVLESNFITPLVQQRLISVPPAVIIIMQLLMAPLTGGWGLVLATPLLVIIMVLVQELYVKKQNSS
ncbi:MAG TPA: AI-2E family transporter [Flavisolibacter sp.]|nr:AI-2E family transporter [Flavisolibacter sp.]